MKVGSLCSGYGGLDIAVCAHYGAEVAWHAEIDPDASAVLEKRWPGVPNLGDLTVTDWATVEPVDILTAGYPCQPFSTAGQRKGTADVRHLWPDVARAVGELRPRIIVLENVPGHLSLGGPAVIADLAALGYLGRWGVVPASAAGAPHRRDRVFIVARDANSPRADAHATTGGPRHPTGKTGVSPSTDSGDTRHGALARGTRGDAGGDGENGADLVDCGGEASPDTDRQRREGTEPEPCGDDGGSDPGPVDWAEYAGAIRRWERILGRPAPRDALVGRQLNAKLPEWMMGLPDGWVTDVLPNRKALRVIGNGVCPAHAALALRLLDA